MHDFQNSGDPKWLLKNRRINLYKGFHFSLLVYTGRFKHIQAVYKFNCLSLTVYVSFIDNNAQYEYVRKASFYDL